ncbi:MAG: hypothetical protein RBT34_03050 [Anaerolineaceae bacterium]|nr:hypothetical protein [Anaerolineaceae bacterium]
MNENLMKNELDREAAQEEGLAENLQIIDDEVKVEDIHVGSIQAQQVDLHQSAVETLNSAQTTARFSAVARSTSEQLNMDFGAIGVMKTGDAQLKASAAGVIVADEGVNMDISRAQVILSRGNVVMDKSMAVVAGGRKVKAENSNVVFLLAGKVEGSVQPLFGSRESLIFGAVAGLVGGILVLTGRLFKNLGNQEHHQNENQDD